MAIGPNMDQRERLVQRSLIRDLLSGCWGSRCSDHRRVRRCERKIGGWDTEGATSVKQPPVVLLKV